MNYELKKHEETYMATQVVGLVEKRQSNTKQPTDELDETSPTQGAH